MTENHVGMHERVVTYDPVSAICPASQLEFAVQHAFNTKSDVNFERVNPKLMSNP